MPDIDRVVHATQGEKLLVRYSQSGTWAIEWDPPRMRPMHQVALQGAVDAALEMAADGGTVHLDRPGGRTFAARFRAAQEAAGPGEE